MGGYISMEDYLDFHITGDLVSDIQKYFLKFDKLDTYKHTLEVVN